MPDRSRTRAEIEAGARREGAVWALCVWATVLLGLTVAGAPGAPGRPEACERPREVSAERGWTRVVGCTVPPGGGHPLRGPVRWLYGQRVDLGSADARLLEALPGIGPARAAAIVEARRSAPFDSLDALRRAHGVGPSTVRRLRPWLRVTPPPRTPAAPARPDQG